MQRCSIFSQMPQLFPRLELERAVRRHHSDRQLRVFACQLQASSPVPPKFFLVGRLGYWAGISRIESSYIGTRRLFVTERNPISGPPGAYFPKTLRQSVEDPPESV